MSSCLSNNTIKLDPLKILAITSLMQSNRSTKINYRSSQYQIATYSTEKNQQHSLSFELKFVADISDAAADLGGVTLAIITDYPINERLTVMTHKQEKIAKSKLVKRQIMQSRATSYKVLYNCVFNQMEVCIALV